MEQKKSLKADLENKKGIFFMFGLVVALGLTLLAFDWTGRPSKAETFGPVQTQAIEDEYIPITREPEVKPPVPPPVQTVEILNIVDNNTDIKDELKIEATDVTDNTIFDVTPIIQPKEEEEEKEQIYFNSVEEPAEFPGGEKALTKYIKDHVNYPMIAAENGVEGRVIIQFVVNEEGDATNAEVIRSVDINLDKEALRVIRSLPKFKPGKQRGKAVKVYYIAPINFQLQ